MLSFLYRTSIDHTFYTYLTFSSCVPRVNNTKPHKSSLNAIPFWVPPQATYKQSASTDGIPSDRTSCRNATLLNDDPFDPDDFLNASLIRRNSLCVTENNYIKLELNYKEKSLGLIHRMFLTF